MVLKVGNIIKLITIATRKRKCEIIVYISFRLRLYQQMAAKSLYTVNSTRVMIAHSS